MGLEEDVRAMLEEAQAAGRSPVPEALQGVAKERVRRVLTIIDRNTDDIVDAVYALLDDERDSWFSRAAQNLRFADGATIAHIGAHIGILQRGNTRKLDREGRDYWVKPLCDVGAMERVTLFRDTGEFVDGHPIAKSPNSAYRLASSFVEVLRSPEEHLEDTVGAWIGAEATRQRLELQARMAEEASRKVDKKHAALIKATVGVYTKTFLPDYEVLYIDDRDGDRIPEEAQRRLDDAGIELRLADAMPDVLLWRPGTTSFWVIEAVTSDGEVDLHKVSQVEKCLQRTMEAPEVGFTTAYRTWRDVARRQGKHKNLAPESYLWIQEDPSRHFLVETFERQDHYHFVLR